MAAAPGGLAFLFRSERTVGLVDIYKSTVMVPCLKNTGFDTKTFATTHHALLPLSEMWALLRAFEEFGGFAGMSYPSPFRVLQ